MPEPNRLILRFINAEGPTVDLHDEVLREHGHVWWGWWRKAFEDARLDVLEAAKKDLPAAVGLVNRREGRFYRAWCVNIAIADEGKEIETPDRDSTPTYYRDGSFPAWFCLVEIEEVDEAGWAQLVGDVGVPVGDATLLWVERRTPEGADLEPSQEIRVLEYEAPGDGILHLTDLHYGDDHGFPLSAPPMQFDRPMRELIVRRVEQLGGAIGVLVVSGDLTTKSHFNTLQTVAGPQIRDLAADLGLGVEHVVIVPGNHDISLSTADPQATRTYRHELAFRGFLKSFYGDGDDRQLEAIHSYRTPGGATLNFATLNSVRLAFEKTQEYGYVGPRSGPVMERLVGLHGGRTTTELAGDRVFNFAVLHHHLVSGSLLANPRIGKPVSVTLDAGKLISEFQGASVHVALHGHQHVPFLGTVARGPRIGLGGWDGYKRPLTVIGGGSAGIGLERYDDEMHDNTFGIYHPREGCIDVAMELFNKGRSPETFLRTQIDF